nr:hypothetical protein [uncultured Celeribacter sp.]
MPKLVKLYITQVLIGFAVAAAFVGALLYFNVVNMWHLVSHSDIGWLAVLVLWFANGIVFSGVQFGITIMRMADRDDEDTGGKRDDLPVADYEPIPVSVTETSQRRG